MAPPKLPIKKHIKTPWGSSNFQLRGRTNSKDVITRPAPEIRKIGIIEDIEYDALFKKVRIIDKISDPKNEELKELNKVLIIICMILPTFWHIDF